MALPVTTLAPRTRARASRSISSYRPAVRRLVLVLLLARVALLVLSGRVSANVVWPSSDHDRVDHRRTTGRRLDVVVTGSTDVGAGAVDQRRATILQGSPTVLPQEESRAGRQTMGDTLVVAGVIGLLGVAGAATFLAHSIARPVRRAVRVLQAPADGLDQRVLLVTRDELLDAAADAGSPTSAHVIPVAAEPAATLQAAAPGGGGTAPEVEARSVVPEIARVVREAAHKAAQQAAQEAAQEAARAAEAAAAASSPAARSAVPTGYAAARSRAVGPTTALWHAVELARLVGAVGEACETTVCGSLVRVSAGQSWPVPARDVCPACATVAR